MSFVKGLFCSWNFLAVIILMFGALICLEMTLYFECLGSPYLYVTFHGDVKTVAKYSRNGCVLKSNILKGNDHVQGGRAIATGLFHKKPVLYVIDAGYIEESQSQVLVYGDCDLSSYRHYLTSISSLSSNPGANLAYGIDFDYQGNIYASFQGSNSVLRFAKDTFAPMSLPSHLIFESEKLNATYNPGTFFQFPPELDGEGTGIRSITFVGENLWVCNAPSHAVFVIDSEGEIISTLSLNDPMRAPLGLHYDKNNRLVFVSTKLYAPQTSGASVFAVDPLTMQIIRNFTADGMTHCSGVTSYEDTLFVADQHSGSIFSFSISSGKFLTIIQSHFPDKIEHLSLSPC
jgi:DNA-binding beta-propeller fold protein YncE